MLILNTRLVHLRKKRGNFFKTVLFAVEIINTMLFALVVHKVAGTCKERRKVDCQLPGRLQDTLTDYQLARKQGGFCFRLPQLTIHQNAGKKFLDRCFDLNIMTNHSRNVNLQTYFTEYSFVWCTTEPPCVTIWIKSFLLT